MNQFQLTSPDETSQATLQCQDILNTILKNYDVPYIKKVGQESIRFGAYRHHENSLILDTNFPRLVLVLRDPERLLGKTFWHIAHNYNETKEKEKAAVEERWNIIARKVLNCNSLSITGYQETLSHISITFDLRNVDRDMLKATKVALALTYLEVKDASKKVKILH
jgi:arginyl-tRNA synthetase